MTDDKPTPIDPAATPPTTPTSPGPDRPSITRSGRLEPYFTIVPIMAFVVGVLLGALVVALTGVGVRQSAVSTQPPTSTTTDASAPGAASGTSPATGTPSDVTVTIPAECVQLTDNSQQLIDLVNQAATAAKDLDAAKLSGIVAQLQQSQTTLKHQTDACRNASAK